MQLNNVDGCYYPSFFCMKLDTSEDTYIALEKNTQTFIHEFIHYLQDLLLPYSIRLNLTNLSLFVDVQQSAKQKEKLVRPFHEWDENSRLLKKQQQYTLGKPQFLAYKPCIQSIKHDHFVIPSTGAKVYKYTLQLTQPRKNYHISALDMLEYIAHKIETKHYEDSTYQTPYKTIDYIFDFYQLSDIPSNIRLNIVEYCLYNDNPVHLLFNAFFDSGFIKAHKDIFTDYSACYELLLHQSTWTAVGNFHETVNSKTQRRLNDFKNELINHFNAPQFNSIIHWLETVTAYVRTEFVDRFIFSDMYQMNLQELSDSISEIIDAIGFPLILNKDYKCISLLSASDDTLPFIQFHILQNFLQFVETKEQACPIYDFCNANGSICTKSCKTLPYLGKNDDNDICPYLLFLKTYNLTNIV